MSNSLALYVDRCRILRKLDASVTSENVVEFRRIWRKKIRCLITMLVAVTTAMFSSLVSASDCARQEIKNQARSGAVKKASSPHKKSGKPHCDCVSSEEIARLRRMVATLQDKVDESQKQPSRRN